MSIIEDFGSKVYEWTHAKPDTTATPATPGVLDAFKAKAADFVKMFEFLKGKRRVAMRDPVLKEEYERLMRNGGIVKSGIEKVTQAVDYLTGWYKQTFGGLGAPLLVPIAIVVASVAAMSFWLSDAYIFARKLDEVARLEAKGLSPQQAAATVAQNAPKGFFAGAIGGPVLTLAVGGIAILLILRAMKK